MVERKVLLENLPLDSSPSIVRLINMYNPVKSLQTLSADSDLTLAQVRNYFQTAIPVLNFIVGNKLCCLQVFNIAGHLIYWGDAIVIFPISETNMYAIAPNVPTERNSKFAKKFEKKFPGQNLLEVIYIF